MSILNKLSNSLNRRDEVPNQDLAKQLASNGDKKSIQELVVNLSNKDKAIQSDCIKVLYEIGYLKPSLIADYSKEFLSLLKSKNNRMQWGAMIALGTIVSENSKALYDSLPVILDAADAGSVITKDNAVRILIGLCSVSKYNKKVFPLLIEQLISTPTNQLPMYAEMALPVINKENKDLFVKTLSSRLKEIEKDSKRIRVEKVIAKCK